MTMDLFLEGLVALLIVIGGIFTLVGSVGLLKLSRPMPRLHAPTKASTLGVGAILMASMVLAFWRGEGSLHELLITCFMFVTAPISALFIAKVHLHRGEMAVAPPHPPKDDVWATLDTPEEDLDLRKPGETPVTPAE
ncbi:Na+/H+ antiporter subunit G [Pseudooceanicola nanhaiensis]|uniref:Na+/H+ antiporter subunit G n=1 Tax=Pseudooceanicola nanhaiensis TaxID=375761 RepID=UPI001CD5D53A|nr:Na+/H+ antiporter subunit G [Pseudooceanicola nanhaiensis]MCA0921199.1 Na+/H+ antiporter subunit G [Pseudooceanicola nanhaiensis]